MTDAPEPISESEVVEHGCVMALMGMVFGFIVSGLVYLIHWKITHYNGGFR